MAEIIKETLVTKEAVASTNPLKVAATSNQTAEYLVYFLFGGLEILLAFRLIFKLVGASLNSFFVNFVYTLSGLFIMPFEGIFRKAFARGVETTAILEPSVVVAILVYATLSWGTVKLIRILSGEQQDN